MQPVPGLVEDRAAVDGGLAAVVVIGVDGRAGERVERPANRPAAS